jgi:hypothetical protein
LSLTTIGIYLHVSFLFLITTKSICISTRIYYKYLYQAQTTPPPIPVSPFGDPALICPKTDTIYSVGGFPSSN